MCKHRECIKVLVLVVALSATGAAKPNKINRIHSESDVLKKSEITLKSPVYALKTPPVAGKVPAKRTSIKVDPVTVNCTSHDLNDLRKKIQCIPRDTVVEISAQDGDKIVPNTVVVKRCGGMCSGNRKCVPSNTTETDFCNRIKVVEHTTCECRCLTRKSCSADQKYDPKLCECVCTNKEAERECWNRAETNFTWSAETCSCVCRSEKICTTGTVWSGQSCKCVRK